ncbi:MAG: VOC family protein [Bacteroidales bacterium]|jgi:predicted enzyme related to lactoylglutathione lyase
METEIKDMIILYVADQQRSRDFYKAILNKEPSLDVPGMTEFALNEKTQLGLMPENGIAKILGDALPHPAKGNGIPRCEIYIAVENVKQSFDNLILNGGKAISEPQMRNWGHVVAYGSDPDGHVIALASAGTDK